MYKIIKNGEVVAITEKLNFIKQGENGVYYSCTEKEAQGVAVKNKPYNLLGREAMAELETVIAVKVDAGEILYTGETEQTDTDAIVIDHEYRLTLLELGAIEV